MLSRIVFATGFAILSLLAFAWPANAATDSVKVGVGTLAVVLVTLGVWFVAFLVKWYFGLAVVTPPPLEDDHSSHAAH
jgi:hypothetical protein